MIEKEKIKVYVCFEDGRTICICKRPGKMCDCKTCLKEVVERDQYRDLDKLATQDKFGNNNVEV